MNIQGYDFYPRPPRGGRRPYRKLWVFVPKFLSTPSARRATRRSRRQRPSPPISIHALREEGDHRRGCQIRQDRNFYPRPPRGGRQIAAAYENRKRGISIHALREEGDVRIRQVKVSSTDFYPRPPRGGRPYTARTGCGVIEFLSTPSARRAT